MLARLIEFLGGAAIGAIAVIAGFVLKEFAFPRLFESWKTRNSIRTVFRKYRDPLFAAGAELAHRLSEICREYPPAFLTIDRTQDVCFVASPNDASDSMYLAYKQLSSVYRFAAFLGWLELYRRDLVYLDSGHRKTNVELEQCLSRVRSALADGHLNKATDWSDWTDRLLFREELRAIGESMIVVDDTKTATVLGYGRFCEIYLGKVETSAKKWHKKAASFLVDPPARTERNFQLVRIKLLVVHLTKLLALLNKSRVPSRLTQYSGELLSKGLDGVIASHES
jgi:hypothetical protein